MTPSNRVRVLILRIHGTLAIAMGVVLAALSTIGMWSGRGPLGLLQEQPFAHVGLVQAYGLAAVVGIALWLGSRQADPRPWNRIGALAHLAILPAYWLHWDLLGAIAPEGAALRRGVVLHVALVLVEAWAGLTPTRPARAGAR